MKELAKYSVCNYASDNKLLHWFFNRFYNTYKIEKEIAGTKYIVEYNRSPFWGYEKPSLRLFIKDKLLTWHGQVWEVFPSGSHCGFGTTCFTALFPAKRMRKFLDRESKWVWECCNKNVE